MSLYDNKDKDSSNIKTGHISGSESSDYDSNEDTAKSDIDTEEEFYREDIATAEEEGQKPKKGNAVKVIAGVGVAAVIAAGSFIFLSGGKNSDNSETTASNQNNVNSEKGQSEINSNPSKPVVKRTDGVNSSTTDPDLKAALGQEKPPVPQNDQNTPFKDLHEGDRKTTDAPLAPPSVDHAAPPAVTNPTAPQAPQAPTVAPTPVAPEVTPVAPAPAPVETHTPQQDHITPQANGQVGSDNLPSVTQKSEISAPISPAVPTENKADSEKANSSVDTSTKVDPVSPAPNTSVNPVAPIEQNTQDSNNLIGGGDSDSGMLDPSSDNGTEENSASVGSDLNDSVNKVISQMATLNGTVKKLNAKVDSLDKTIVVNRQDFDKLVQRVNDLEKVVKNGTSTGTAVLCDTSSKKVKHKATPTKHVAKRSSSRHVSHDSISVVQKSGDLSYKEEVHYKHRAKKSFSGKMSLESVVGNRAWVRVGNGPIRSYSIGDTLPNGKVIGNVDSVNGVYDKSGSEILSR